MRFQLENKTNGHIATDALIRRRPGLINLPLPVPSIPIVAPVVTLLVGGSNPTKTVVTTSPTATPLPTNTSNGDTGGNGNGGNSGGGNNNGNSGGNSGGSGGGGSGGGNGGGNTGVSSSTRIQSPPTGDHPNAPGAGSSTETKSTTVSKTLLNNANVLEPSGPPGNAGGIPTFLSDTVGGSSTDWGGTHAPSATGGPKSGDGGSSGNGGNGSGNGGDGGDGNVNNGIQPRSGGLSTGAIAAIVVILLAISIGALVFLLRRRARARQHSQAHHWWFSRKRTSQAYDDHLARPPQRSNSTCSSFATAFDRSTSPLPDQHAEIPPLPFMTDVGRSTLITPDSMLGRRLSDMEGRFSSPVSWSHGQHHDTDSRPDSPILGAPITPTHASFSFTLSPPSTSTAKASLYPYVPNSIAAQPITLPTSYFRTSMVALPPLPPLPTSPPPTPEAYTNPFADDNPFKDPHPV